MWKYSLFFDYLPVCRFVQVLDLEDLSAHSDPCSSPSCHPLMNNRARYICVCQEGFTGENCREEDRRCQQGYCSKGSSCQPIFETSVPFCVCPFNRLGDRARSLPISSLLEQQISCVSFPTGASDLSLSSDRRDPTPADRNVIRVRTSSFSFLSSAVFNSMLCTPSPDSHPATDVTIFVRSLTVRLSPFNDLFCHDSISVRFRTIFPDSIPLGVH